MMTDEEEAKTLHSVYHMVRTNPRTIKRVMSAVTEAIEDSVGLAQKKAADMEALAIIGIGFVGIKNRATPSCKQLLEDKAAKILDDYKGETFGNWDERLKSCGG